MNGAMFADTAKVMPKGQVTIPKDVRGVLGVKSGDRVTFLVEGSTVHVVNAASHARQMLQQDMTGETARAKTASEEDVMGFATSVRAEA